MSALLSFEDDVAAAGPGTLTCPWCGVMDANVSTLEFCGPDDVKSLTCGRCSEGFVARLRVSVRLEACRSPGLRREGVF